MIRIVDGNNIVDLAGEVPLEILPNSCRDKLILLVRKVCNFVNIDPVIDFNFQTYSEKFYFGKNSVTLLFLGNF